MHGLWKAGTQQLQLNLSPNGCVVNLTHVMTECENTHICADAIYSDIIISGGQPHT